MNILACMRQQCDAGTFFELEQSFAIICSEIKQKDEEYHVNIRESKRTE